MDRTRPVVIGTERHERMRAAEARVIAVRNRDIAARAIASALISLDSAVGYVSDPAALAQLDAARAVTRGAYDALVMEA